MDDGRRADLLRYLGFSGQAMSSDLKERIDGVIERCLEEQEPRGIFAVYPVSVGTDRSGVPAVFVRGTTLVFRGNSIAEYMEGASYCALSAVTLGLESERRLRQLGALNATDQAVYSCVCSDLVECGADRMEAQVVAYARERGLYAKERFSPGYGDFGIGIQADFVRVLQADKYLGIYVTPSSFLVPSKSTTSVIGLFGEPPGGAQVGCANCSCRQYCTIRQSGSVCYKRRRGD